MLAYWNCGSCVSDWLVALCCSCVQANAEKKAKKEADKNASKGGKASKTADMKKRLTFNPRDIKGSVREKMKTEFADWDPSVLSLLLVEGKPLDFHLESAFTYLEGKQMTTVDDDFYPRLRRMLSLAQSDNTCDSANNANSSAEALSKDAKAPEHGEDTLRCACRDVSQFH